MNKNFDTICLSGGGINGLSFLGIINYLQTIKFINLSLIKNWVGTSVGGLICYLLTIGYSIEELENFILEFNFEKLEPNYNIENILLYKGVDNREKLKLLIKSFLKAKYGLDDITFLEHYKLTQKKLCVVGTNYTKGKESIFDYIHTPNVSVITAIMISACIPGFYMPVLLKSEYYIDGGVTNFFPINLCNYHTTLGIYIKYEYDTHIKSIFSFLSGCLTIVTNLLSNKENMEGLNIIKFSNNRNSFLKFNLDKKDKQYLINLGKKCAKKYVKKLSVNLCTDIINDILNNIFQPKCTDFTIKLNKSTQTDHSTTNEIEIQTDEQ
jgi:predicted patatin/cPLA2 family phospholipase